MNPVITSSDLRRLEEARTRGKDELDVSLDLGKSKIVVKIVPDGFMVDNQVIAAVKVRSDEKSCFVLVDGKLEKLQIFSPETNKLYKLIPTSNKPLLQVSGTSMHKREFVDRVAQEKLHGRVLDAGTGLGYTALVAAKTADEVVTVEVDPNVLTLAEYNPWSVGLFDNPKIKIYEGDVIEEVKDFSDASFDAAVLDGGTPHASGMFFSSELYQEVFRVLKKKSRVLHYLPRVHKTKGRDFPGEVIDRMLAAGFSLVEQDKDGCFVV
ncbi:MAG: methyltransferase domain-containing protein, partial [Nanoarchaeota archaeon]|nr:methyltransferase domain-containing protein [Nanoarchaeota archaeon]